MPDNMIPLGKTDEQVQDIVAALLSEQGNISLNYDDANDQLTIDTSALNEEQVEDAVAALITGDSNVGVAYDDGNGQLTLSLSGPVTGVQIGSESNPVDGYFSSANIGSLGGAGAPYSVTDGSDITEYTATDLSGDATLVNITGEGVLLSGLAHDSDRDPPNAQITVDGSSFNVDGATFPIGGGGTNQFGVFPSVKFENSLQITVYVGGSGGGTAWVRQ